MTPAARRACAVLYRAGWPLTAVAALTGVHHTTVWRALRREGVNVRGRWG
jgi:IS30 family transposase